MANRCCQIQLLFYLVCYLASGLLSVFACCRSSFRGDLTQEQLLQLDDQSIYSTCLIVHYLKKTITHAM